MLNWTIVLNRMVGQVLGPNMAEPSLTKLEPWAMATS